MVGGLSIPGVSVKKSANKETKKCNTCGIIFYRPYKCGMTEWSQRKYCSGRCYHASRFGERSRNWKGGRKVNPYGYIEIYKPECIYSDCSGYVKEHIFVMSEYLGRKLSAGEVVHHINEDRSDNRIENLRLMARSDHVSLHLKGRRKSKEHCKKISDSKKAIVHLIQRNVSGQFMGGVHYGG
ncbi:MAG: HNH endonuclease signature motif containing protein [Thermodesulfobacteriota bacterium]|jgi:hypothetical protein|nr:HNH endonuclease signature motif containing protein [Thermodesulfobacteriota bacterium]